MLMFYYIKYLDSGLQFKCCFLDICQMCAYLLKRNL
jgi:hypothetical protein